MDWSEEQARQIQEIFNISEDVWNSYLETCLTSPLFVELLNEANPKKFITLRLTVTWEGPSVSLSRVLNTRDWEL